jgi:Protein of unknown function (DUF992)
MMMFRYLPRFMFATGIIGLAMATPAAAQSRLEVGNLECRGGGAMSFVLGSVNEYACVFHAGGGRQQRYVATIRRFGVDLGYTGQTLLSWLVFAPTRRVGYGDLAGNYVGASGSAAIGAGLSANALTGGSNNSIGLQPLSVGGGGGLNIAAGVANLELRPAVRPGRRHS